MTLAARLNYYRRISSAYLLPGKSQLTFWHDQPQENSSAPVDQLGEYYMPFVEKAGYAGAHDALGIPLLDYRGNIGLQYNPIAIAQWGLGNFNLLLRAQGSRAPEEVGGRGGLAGDASGGEFFRRSRLEPLVRLGVPNPAEGALVFRTGSGTGNLSAGAGRARDRKV